MLAPTRLLGLSDIKKIGEKKVNPQAKDAEAQAKEICQEVGMYQSNFGGYNTMAGFLFPAAMVDRLTAVIIFYNFLYYVDDIFDRHHQQTDQGEDHHFYELFEGCTQIMLTGEYPPLSNNLFDACMAVHQHVRPLTNEKWLNRFIAETHHHLNSSRQGLADFYKDDNDPIDAYIALRRLDSGMSPTISTIEFVNDFYLPEIVKCHPTIRGMEEALANIGGLMNDIFSYEKEVLLTNSRCNLVAVLEDEWGLPFAEAVHEAVNIVNQNVDRFLTLEAELPYFENEELSGVAVRYGQYLRDQVNACWHWQLSTDRYRSPDSPFPELQTPALATA